jgi:multicomponent Na+:H+ antiporter subunit G
MSLAGVPPLSGFFAKFIMVRAAIETREYAAAATLGVGLLLAAAAVEFGELAVTTRVIAAAVFIAMTAPVAAHLLGRAAYFLGVPLWEGSVRDELRGRYNERAHALASMEELLGEGRLAPGRATRRGADVRAADEEPGKGA